MSGDEQGGAETPYTGACAFPSPYYLLYLDEKRLTVEKIKYIGPDRVAPESRKPIGFRAFIIGGFIKGG